VVDPVDAKTLIKDICEQKKNDKKLFFQEFCPHYWKIPQTMKFKLWWKNGLNKVDSRHCLTAV